MQSTMHANSERRAAEVDADRARVDHPEQTPRRATLRLIGGAVGFLAVSRLMGIARETAVVSLVGVHDFTDAYFGMSAFVLWAQNWAFGAFALYFVPKYVSLHDAVRASWYVRLRRRFMVIGGTAAVIFVAAYPMIESAMLGGRAVLRGPPVWLLAASLPLTLLSGIAYNRLNSEARGILVSARLLVIANAAGLFVVVVGALTITDRALVLPLTLFVTQAATAILLSLGHRGKQSERRNVVPETKARVVPDVQLFATIAENVVFNANAVGQQAAAGGLGAGAVTLNAYAARFILVPLTGLLQPVQQRLLLRFAASDERSSIRATNVVIAFSASLGVAAGVVAGAVLSLSLPWWPEGWQAAFRVHQYVAVLVSYGAYAGVAFANQALARLSFACGKGWEYAGVMASAYAIGTGLRFAFANDLGIVAVPLGGLVAEGAAMGVLLFRANARNRSGLDVAE
jgi:hypothetical protein